MKKRNRNQNRALKKPKVKTLAIIMFDWDSNILQFIDLFFIGHIGGDAIAGVVLICQFFLMWVNWGLGSGVTASARFIGERTKLVLIIVRM